MRTLKDWLFAQYERLTLHDAVPDWLHRHNKSESTDKGRVQPRYPNPMEELIQHLNDQLEATPNRHREPFQP